MSDSSTPSPSVAPGQSAKTRRKQKQRRKKKSTSSNRNESEADEAGGLVEQALQQLKRHPTIANGFRAWLAYLHHSSTVHVYISAVNFARVFQIECARSSGRPEICESQLISSDFLEFSINEFAGCFIIEKNIEQPSKIAMVSSNLCCFVWFLGKYFILPTYEVEMLHDLCRDIGLDMIRSVRAERVGEAYSSYVRGAYEDHGFLGNIENLSLFKGGFEVAYVGARFCLLRDFQESELDHAAFQRVEPVKVRLPLPLTRQLRIGDHLHLEIRRIQTSSTWVPTECYGVYPDSGEEDDLSLTGILPEISREVGSASSGSCADSISLADNLSWVNLGTSARNLARNDIFGTNQRRHTAYIEAFAERAAKDLTPDGFDEGKFTDSYFSSLETDIADDDEGFGIFENGYSAEDDGLDP